MNLADAGVLIVVAMLVVVGFRRGLIGQLLLLAATLVSLLAAAVVAYAIATRAEAVAGWVALASPIAFFVALAVTSWITRLLARAATRVVHSLPFASLDRLAGALVSVVVGAIILSLLVLGLASIPAENPVTETVSTARSTPWLLATGHWTAAAVADHVELLAPLARGFESASERVGRPFEIPGETL